MAQLIAHMAPIMEVAGMNWTMPCTDGWDNSNMAMYSGDFETMARVERSTGTVHSAEGQARGYGGMRACFTWGRLRRTTCMGWEQPRSRWPRDPVLLRANPKSGRIKIAKKIEEPVTVQDPCNIVRGRGLHEKLRFVVNALSDFFIDMDPRYEHNYCCPQPAEGVINCGPIWKLSRMKSIRVKAERVEADRGPPPDRHELLRNCQ